MCRLISVLTAGLAVLLLAGAAPAQFPPTTAYFTSIWTWPTTPPAGVLGIDAKGQGTAFVSIQSQSGFAMMEMNPTNDGLMLLDGQGIHHLDFNTQRTRLATLNNTIAGMTIDEEAGLLWNDNGTLYHSLTTLCTNPTRLTTIQVTGMAGSAGPCWNGSTGGYVTCSRSGTRQGVLEFFRRTGHRELLVSKMSFINDIDWSPWTGDLILTDNFGFLLRAGQNGAITTIAPVPPWSHAIKVLHQSPGNTERFMFGQIGTQPFHILFATGTGVITTLISGPLTPGWVEVAGSRPLWATGPWKVGSTGHLNLNMGAAHAGDFYRVALSLSHRPGIPFARAGVHLHLTPDVLFALTANGDVPGFTRGFAGRLDGGGRSPLVPTVTIPNVPSLRGIRIFGGALTYNASGITGASNCWGISLQ